jgi:hypothetical protein
MAAAPEVTTEFPTCADGNLAASGPQQPVVTARHLAPNWAKAAGLVVAAAAMWLIVIAILIAV